MRVPKRNQFKPDETTPLLAFLLAIGVVVSVVLYAYAMAANY